MWGQNPYQRRLLCLQARMCPLKRARIVPQKKATGPTSLSHICDKDFFVLFSVFNPECEGKIRTKGGFCAPKRECFLQAKIVTQKKATGPMPLGCISKKTFVLIFWSSPEMWGQNPYQRRILCPPKKQQDQRHWDAYAITTFFLVFIPGIFFAPSKFSMPSSFPAPYCGTGSASVNRCEIRLKIIFLEDHNITSLSTICLGLGEDLFCLFGDHHISKAVCQMISYRVDLAFYDLFW